MVTNLAMPALRGTVFGLRRSLDTMGAFASDFRLIFWVATVLAVFAVLRLAIGIREPAPTVGQRRRNTTACANPARLSATH